METYRILTPFCAYNSVAYPVAHVHRGKASPKSWLIELQKLIFKKKNYVATKMTEKGRLLNNVKDNFVK